MKRASMAFFAVAVCGSLFGNALHPKEPPESQHPLCFFNLLCTCSKSFPDLGRVTCKNVPLLRIPIHIHTSKVYTIHLENNGLRALEPYFLQNTGLHSIEISLNLLTNVAAEAFTGLERSLWELDLHGNHLSEIPSHSLRHLQKLKSLDLSDNEITFVSSEEWKGLEESLETLFLRGNQIVALQPSSFASLKHLHTLDLSGNALFEVDGNTFKYGPLRLVHLNLADNVLSRIPLRQLVHLKFLKHLNLSLNRISEMPDPKSEMTLSLDTLRLDYNQIQFLPADSFKYFVALNRTYFNGNPISKIQENAFRESRIQELFLRDCSISEVRRETFAGLESSLRVVDLSGNSLMELSAEVFDGFSQLRTLLLEENFLLNVDTVLMRNLEELNLRGIEHAPVVLRSIGKLQNLRSLSLSKISGSSLTPSDFAGFSSDFEELKICDGNVKTLRSHAFGNVRRLKRLDLSGNSISTIESEAFAEVGHFLQDLCLFNGLSPDLSRLPSDSLRHLSALQHLDVSNNNLKHLEESSFHSMRQLRTLHLQDNHIEFVGKSTFRGDVHSELNEILLSFNQLRIVTSKTFADLGSLRVIRLDDNRIEELEKNAFVNLEKLKNLNLRGNKISFISQETFENLPELEELDLAYNRLTGFSYTWMDQVGVLSSMRLNVSHNFIDRLAVDAFPQAETIEVNVKVMDFSRNNISHIDPSYFRQIESSLTHLYLSHNALTNVTTGILDDLVHLQWLDLSHNFVQELDSDAFARAESLQVIKLSENQLSAVPKDIFSHSKNLKIVEMASNFLAFLPDALFKVGTIERLDLSANQLSRIPVHSFQAEAAFSVAELILSNNAITTLQPIDAFQRFRNLYWLDLSGNPIIRIDDGVFSQMSRLRWLDISHNPGVTFNAKGEMFYGLENVLENLYLGNLSLNEVPELHLPHLKTLDLSDNNLMKIPTELSHNLPSLRRLELSNNRLTSIPLVISSLTHLQYLGLSGNLIELIMFHRGSRLRELDIRNLRITYHEMEIFDHLQYLQTLRLSLRPGINLPRLLQWNHAVEHVHVESFEDVPPFGKEMKGTFPPKLRSVTLTGRGFRVITKDIFEGIISPRLKLFVFNTSIEEIPKTIFENATHARNVTVDVRSNGLRSLGNPNSGRRPNMPKKAFLLSLKMEDNKWSCDCNLGWIEGWNRARRRYLCEDSMSTCFGAEDDLRMASCANTQRSVLEALKTEIECGWNSSCCVCGELYLVVILQVWLIFAERKLSCRSTFYLFT